MMAKVSGALAILLGLILAGGFFYFAFQHHEFDVMGLGVIVLALFLIPGTLAFAGRTVMPLMLLWFALAIGFLGRMSDPSAVDETGWGVFLFQLVIFAAGIGTSVAGYVQRRRRLKAEKNASQVETGSVAGPGFGSSGAL
jgi:hypothetical protein